MKIPYPFLPVEVREEGLNHRVNVVGREMVFGADGMPVSVKVNGEELLAGKSTKIEWYKPVFADDVLTGRVTITNLVRRNEKNGLAELTFEVCNQNGELVLNNISEIIVKCRMPKGSGNAPDKAHR